MRMIPGWTRRRALIIAVAALVLVAVYLSVRESPVLVDTATVERDTLLVAVEEEGRTRLPDRYRVTAPLSGELNRVVLEPGDRVERGQTLFTVNPAPAEALDARQRAQAAARLAGAEASLTAALKEVDAQAAQAELAETERRRIESLVRAGHMPRDALDRAEATARSAEARLESARFRAEVARHERDNARAVLRVAAGTHDDERLTVTSPIDGVVLTRERQSAGRVAAGESIMTLGDLNRLQVEVDLLSPDAVRLEPGLRVELNRWGGDRVLEGRVTRIEPSGFTHISALGVEEQRVWVIVDFASDRAHWRDLGDGYRVEARFVLWEGDKVLQVPASALFREETQWSVFVLEDGRAQLRKVEPGRRAGLMTQVLDGLEPGEVVILHPGEDVRAARRVETR